MFKLISLVIFSVFAALPTDVPYAKIGSGTVLYIRENDVYTEAFTLPQSYYVAVISENEDGYSLVSYLSVTGYAPTSSLSKVDFIPKEKYSKATFTVDNDSQPANLRARAQKDATVLAVMPSGAGGTVLGKTRGDELISGAGSTWYYVRYEDGGQFTYGYAYAPHISAQDFGTASTEAEPSESSAMQNGQDAPKAELSLPVRIVIIIALCIPVAVAAFMLRPRKKDSQ